MHARKMNMEHGYQLTRRAVAFRALDQCDQVPLARHKGTAGMGKARYQGEVAFLPLPVPPFTVYSLLHLRAFSIPDTPHLTLSSGSIPSCPSMLKPFGSIASYTDLDPVPCCPLPL